MAPAWKAGWVQALVSSNLALSATSLSSDVAPPFAEPFFCDKHYYSKNMWWFFYVLQSQKDLNWFYKGSTNSLKKRLIQHNNGETQSNKYYRPFRLVYFEAYKT
jgi:hypothetical protein